MPVIVSPVNTKYFEGLRLEAGLTYRELADKLGMDVSALHNKLNGKRRITAADAMKIAKVFRKDVDEVLKRVGELKRGDPENVRRETARSLKVVGWLDEHGVVVMRGVLPPKQVPRPGKVTSDCVVVREQSTGPMSGWLYYYEPTEGIAKGCVGQLCIIDCEDGRTMLRRIVEEKRSGDFVVVKVTGGKNETVTVKNAAIVLWIKPL